MGEHLNPGYDVLVQLKMLLKKVGLPEICFHDLRHSTATLLLEQGINPQDRLTFASALTAYGGQ